MHRHHSSPYRSFKIWRGLSVLLGSGEPGMGCGVCMLCKHITRFNLIMLFP